MKPHRSRAPVAFPWKRILSILVLGGAYLWSVAHVARTSLRVGGQPILEGTTVVRIAHNLTEPRVRDAFQQMAHDYEALNPRVRISIQSIPPRAYEQWVTTQLMGGTAPDLVQVLNRFGPWSNLAQQYLVPFTPYISAPNPFNAGTDLADVPWRDTYIDGMEGGYFPHLMDFYSVPLTLNTRRIFYNKDIFREALGHDHPPRSFGEWMRQCEQLSAWAAATAQRLFPIAASVEDEFYNRYFPTLTGGMMDGYDPQLWGVPNPMITLYGLATGTFDLKHERIRAAFTLLRQLAGHFQPSFINDQSEQKRFLFIQQRTTMVVGDTRDLGIYRDLVDFEVGVFDFPDVDADDPTYGRYYTGTAAEAAVGTFSFGLTRSSRAAETALDFIRYCTSRQRNERFCADLLWYPAIKGSRLVDDDLETFAPQTEGVSRYPALTLLTGTTQLYFDQNFPAYLDGQISFRAFMNGLEHVWLTGTPGDVERQIDGWIRNQARTELNVAMSKAKMLFAEAGRLEAGQLVGERTGYQLGLEIIELLDHGNNSRQYTWKHLQQGDYPFPPFPEHIEQEAASSSNTP